MDRSAEEPLVPLSSDECGQSGVDSDEDVITDYLPLAAEPSRSRALSPTDTETDVMAHHLQRGSIGATAGGVGVGIGGPLVPTISVTPHSPAAKHYPVLEDSLQQLHEIHESIQAMRELSCAASAAYGIGMGGFGGSLRLTSVARLSASCPSLNEAANGGIHGCSDPMLDSQGSVGSSPLHMPGSRKSSETQDWLLCRGLQGDTQRRRSWTALEDLSGTKEKVKQNRQRSMSLSSMESEADESSLLDNVDGSTARLLCTDPAITRRGRNSSGGGASTHSLNEADLQNDFNKLKAKREAEQRLLSARLPLQKSVSTPSIIAVRDIAPEPLAQPMQLPIVAYCVSKSNRNTSRNRCRPSGTGTEESETEEEGSRQGSALGHFDIPSATLSLHHLLEHAPYDHHSEKRRKRGSLFFRKKKDKSKKVSHQWVSACYGSTHICDWCSKPLSNKPALYCETCTTTVHQNTCKDNIVDCNKPKISKNSAKLSGFSVSIPNSKSSLTKRGSSAGSQNTSSNRRSQLCYSPWRRVATKLGVNQIINEDKEIDQHHHQHPHHHAHHDNASFADDVPIVPLEFLTETPLTAADLGTDPCLGLHESEPDSWTPHVGKDIARKLKEKEVKRQEHIYEFILTEKHHCLTLLTMQKVFVDGLQKYFQLGPNLERMFPRLLDLTALHLGLLSRLRERQREAPIVTSIADILLEQFSSHHAIRLKSAYGEFCSRHRDAVDIYKYYLQHDARFGQFVRHCQTIPLLKKKGIPECILFVTQRLTKYPLLIEPLIKTSKDNKEEQEMLQKALALVKEILVEVDAQVAEKEKEDRKLEIYNRIDAKSYTTHRGHKFKKSDILQGNRALKFEGVAMLMQGRGKMQVVLVIVLSDVLFFLQENSHKYSFFTPDNKAGVVSLQKLLVREKAGQESRGIYLISSNPADPEMFELKVHKPKDKQVWIQAIRAAVQSCPEDEEDNIALSSEERQKLLNAKQSQVRHLVDAQSGYEGMLRQKDEEQAILLEEKMALQLRLLAAAGLDPPSPPPTYRHLVSEHADTGLMWKEVLSAVQEVSQLASSLYASGTNLSRSVSSVGEHQSETYVSPTLPKRAETFGGFDNTVSGAPPLKIINKKLQCSAGSQAGSPDTESLKPGDSKLFERLPWRNAVLATVPPGLLNGGATSQQGSHPESSLHDLPALLTLGREQQVAAVQLSHYVYTLLCIISQLMTSVDSLQSQLACYKSHGSGSGGPGNELSGDGRKPQYRPNQQLEELRNLQDKLSAEKATWQQARDQEQRDLDDKKQELLRLQEQIRAEQNDITQQREQLYRKMEILTSQGFLISPNVALPVGVPSQSHDEVSPPEEALSSPSLNSPQTNEHSPVTNTNTNTNTTGRKPDGKWVKGASKSTLPLNLISATNQPKAQNIPIKQQLPLKLASRLSSSGSCTPSPNTTPTGSSGGVTSTQSQIQQMLPLRLQEDKEKNRRSSSGSGGGGSTNGGYQRLGSGNFSPPNTEPSMLASMPIASHSRTGSSPAMMQQVSTTSSSSSTTTSYNQNQSQNQNQIHPSSGAKAMRTHTYPKLPDKFRVRSPEQPAPDEEVIFF